MPAYDWSFLADANGVLCYAMLHPEPLVPQVAISLYRTTAYTSRLLDLFAITKEQLHHIRPVRIASGTYMIRNRAAGFAYGISEASITLLHGGNALPCYGFTMPLAFPKGRPKANVHWEDGHWWSGSKNSVRAPRRIDWSEPIIAGIVADAVRLLATQQFEPKEVSHGEGQG